MLAIRLQRTGRKGHAQFRMIVQDSQRSPSSGRVVANLGNYNPHTKEINIDKEKASTFLSNGAQPSERVARILKADGVKLPSWVKIIDGAKKTTKNVEKLRKNRPAEPKAEETPAEEPAKTEESAAETPVETPDEATATEPAPETEAPVESEKAEPTEESTETEEKA